MSKNSAATVINQLRIALQNLQGVIVKVNPHIALSEVPRFQQAMQQAYDAQNACTEWLLGDRST